MTEQHYDFEACRTLGHSWEPDEADGNPDLGWRMKLRCTRCAMERHDTIGPVGALTKRKYRPLAEYRHAQQDRSVWRAQFLSKLTGRVRT